MTKKLRRGFRVEAESYADDYRKELDLPPYAPLAAHTLCEHLAIKVYALSVFSAIDEETRAFFAGEGRSLFSATTLPFGTRRAILHNDFQHPNRQASNIMHEVAHIVLGHPPKPPLLEDKCRNFDPALELEANQLGFTLLVPKLAALYAIEQFSDLIAAADYYGVSVSLLRHRIQITDAHRWAQNRAAKRR